MSSILLSMIHDKATANPPNVKITAANYQIWVDHWFKTAWELVDDFEKECLPATAEAIRAIIIEQGYLRRSERN